MKVTIIGSGGSAVSARRACPSVAVNESILFDLGPGALKNLRASGISMERVSKVFISHPHADHIADLVPFLWANQIDGRKQPLELYGPPGFEEVLSNLLRSTSTSDDFFKFPITVTEVHFGERIGEISTCRTSHSIPTLAFRIDRDGKSFCYSADTIYCPAVVHLARKVDLLLHEATFLEDQLPIAELTYHSTASMAGRAAKEANARRLALFHIPPPNEHREKDFQMQAMQTYGSDVAIGTDFAIFEF